MTTPLSLFTGIAVIIDDEVKSGASAINVIVKQLEDAFCPTLCYSALPKTELIPSFAGVSFFIVDWNLTTTNFSGNEEMALVQIPSQLKKENAKDNVKFLQALNESKFAPIFIFTNELTEEIENILKKENLWSEGNANNIFVMNKNDVINKGVFAVLDDWIANVPSAYVLKKWEAEYNTAKNNFFREFYTNSHYWPIFLWKAFLEDEIPASIEIGAMIGRNVLSRMTPFDFDLSAHSAKYDALTNIDPADHIEQVGKVIQGERFVSRAGLHDDSIAPGDVFYHDGKYYLNIRPDCDCVARGADQDLTEIYLLRGDKIKNVVLTEIFNSKYGNLREQDNEAIVFRMIDQTTVSFKLKNLKIVPWGEWKGRRKGRLLAPHLTRVQQRYSAYLQRPGLPRILSELIPSTAVSSLTMMKTKSQK